MSIARRSALWLALMACALPSQATAQLSPYVMGGIGKAEQESTRNSIARVGAGIEFSAIPVFTPSVETSYLYGHSYQGLTLNGRVNWPIGIVGLDPFFKAGLSRLEPPAGTKSSSPMIGLGVEIDAFDWGIRLETEQHQIEQGGNVSIIMGTLRFSL